MSSKHTKSELTAVFEAIQSLGGQEAVALVHNHLELSRLAAEHLMQSEVEQVAGPRYGHSKPGERLFSRHGTNPGSISIGGMKAPVDVPRLMNMMTGETSSPQVYRDLRALSTPPDHVIRALFLGLGTRHYRDVAETLMDSFGLSKSRLSELFVEHSREILEAFLERRLDDATYVALYVDGKTIQGQSMICVIGVTDKGDKRTLGLTQATTENAGPIRELFKDMIARGFSFDDGILIVVDGGKGLRKAIDDVFGDYAVIQRCLIHKIRNVLDHLSESARPEWRKRLRDLFACEDYVEARSMADAMCADLEKINISAARSLAEGLEEVLTLTRLGLRSVFGRSFATTNVIEAANSAIARTTRHITRWTTGDQRMRWCVMALLDAESSWRKIHRFQRLPMLQRAVSKEVLQRIQSHTFEQSPSRISTKKRT